MLFDGKNLDQWTGGKPEGVEDGAINIFKTGELATKKSFGDCQLHVEWATPEKPEDPMVWGNSGIIFHGKYELQIIESHDVQIYADGIAGAIYGQTPPLVNAARKPGQWQSYDIVFTAPTFDGKKVVRPAYFTVFGTACWCNTTRPRWARRGTATWHDTTTSRLPARWCCNSTIRPSASATFGSDR